MEDYFEQSELLEVADQGLQCQSSVRASGYEGGEDVKDSSAKACELQDAEGAVAKHPRTDAISNSKETNGCEEIDVFRLDAELEQGQRKHEQRLREDRSLKFQPRVERHEDEEKLFIVQLLSAAEDEDQNRVAAFGKNLDVDRDRDSSDYEDNTTDVFRDIEIEDLEAEKENAGDVNVIADVEKLFSRDNSSPLVSKIHYKKLQESSKVESCLVETFEEIII